MPFTIRAHIIEGNAQATPIARTIKGNLRDAAQWLSDHIEERKQELWANGGGNPKLSLANQVKTLAWIQEQLPRLRAPRFQASDDEGRLYEIWPQED
jgi:hypothetical protein